MKLRKKKVEAVGFQLAPMIDMTFLLLIFFMITSKMTKEKVKLDIKLPIAFNAVIPKNVDNREIVNLDKEGNFFIGNNPATKEELTDHLKKRYEKKRPKPLRLYVRADGLSPAKKIKMLMRISAEAGVVDVIFASYGKE